MLVGELRRRLRDGAHHRYVSVLGMSRGNQLVRVQACAVIVNIRDDHQLVCPVLANNAASPARTVSGDPTMERAGLTECLRCPVT